MNRIIAAVGALAATLCFSACVPPPEGVPTTTTSTTSVDEWLPTEVCLLPREGSGGYPMVFHGPVDTLYNTTGWLSGDLCAGASSLRTGNIVRADDEAAAVAKCITILGEEWVLGASPLSDTHDGVPADAWLCRYGYQPE